MNLISNHILTIICIVFNMFFILNCLKSIYTCVKMKYKSKFIRKHIYFIILLSLNCFLILWKL